MGKVKFSDDFKRDAVAQITERGYPVAEVSRRLGVSQHSLYGWKKKFSQPYGGDDKDAEIRRCQRRSKSQPKGGAKVGHFSCGASAWAALPSVQSSLSQSILLAVGQLSHG